MESVEGQPIVYRNGYKEVPVSGDAIHLRTDCQKGDIVWWETLSGNVYEFKIARQDKSQRFWIGELKDHRGGRRSLNPYPSVQLTGERETSITESPQVQKGKRVEFKELATRVKGKMFSEALWESSEVEKMGILRKEPGFVSRLLKR